MPVVQAAWAVSAHATAVTANTTTQSTRTSNLAIVTMPAFMCPKGLDWPWLAHGPLIGSTSYDHSVLLPYKQPDGTRSSASCGCFPPRASVAKAARRLFEPTYGEGL